jgi:hypothetical protein
MFHPETGTLSFLRRALLFILTLGLIGTEIELLLLKHTDGFWQIAPLALIGGAIVVLTWWAATRSAASLRALQVAMLIFLASGVAGVVLHFRGNVNYARDSNPSLSGRELYMEAIVGATPALAPGTMIQLGLLGLAFAFRHPRLRRSDQLDSEESNS